MLALRFTPEVMFQSGQPINVNVDEFLLPFPLGTCLLFLALFPTDAIAICIVCAIAVIVGTGFNLAFIS